MIADSLTKKMSPWFLRKIMELGYWTLAETGHESLIDNQKKVGPMWIPNLDALVDCRTFWHFVIFNRLIRWWPERGLCAGVCTKVFVLPVHIHICIIRALFLWNLSFRSQKSSCFQPIYIQGVSWISWVQAFSQRVKFMQSLCNVSLDKLGHRNIVLLGSLLSFVTHRDTLSDFLWHEWGEHEVLRHVQEAGRFFSSQASGVGRLSAVRRHDIFVIQCPSNNIQRG